MIAMTKDEAIVLMLSSINEDNRDMCIRNGMSEEDTQAQIDQSQPSLQIILTNMYDRMNAAGIIA
jgi:hypothetical protein